MRVEIVERDGVRFACCGEPVGSAGDALGIVAACIENGTYRLLLESRHLPPAFFELRTGLAGEVLQKLQNYRIRVAGVFPSEEGYGDRFRELLREARSGSTFRAFADRELAEAWLCEV